MDTAEAYTDTAKGVILVGRVATTMLLVFMLVPVIVIGAVGGVIVGIVFAVLDVWWDTLHRTWRNPSLTVKD